MLRLIGSDGSKYYSWDLKPDCYTIGRNKECDCFIPDPTISRVHAELEILEDGVNAFITDLQSRNGTTVNGSRITGRAAVRAGNSLTFGQAEFRLVSEEDADKPTPRPTATFGHVDAEKSVYLPIDEALKSLPSKVTDLPELFPTLSDMARTLMLHEPEEVLLEQSLSLVAKVIPAERLAVLFTSDDQQQTYVAATLLSGGKEPGTFILSQTIVDRIHTDKSAVLICDPQNDPRFASAMSIVASELKSAMAVPLFDEGEVLGILYADTTNPLHRYSDEYLRLLATFGNIIASRLLNCRLLREREEKHVMEVELRRASSIQQKLLVRESPDAPGYSIHAYQEQCRAVGGDLYDMTILPDGRFLLLVGDVSGKGMGAALLMANILASFRVLYGQADFNLCNAVAQVSRQVFEFSNPGDFATLFLGVLDTNNHCLEFVNAGHNPPTIMCRDGAKRYAEATGFMIGAFGEGDWQQGKEYLEPGDTLIVFTDGVTEAEGKEGLYGEERMEAIMTSLLGHPPKDIAEALMQDIVRHAEDTPRSDDITMLLVRRDT